MGSAAREARLMARGQNTEKSRCSMALLPPETKIQIMSYISTQQSLSRLAQSCRAWYETATQELYTRDAKEHRSFAIKWMAAHAVDEQKTDSALRTLETSRRWGGQIDAVHCGLKEWESSRGIFQSSDGDLYETSTALHFAVFIGNLRLTKTLLDMEASPEIPCSNLLRESTCSEEVLLRVSYFHSVFGDLFFGSALPILLAFLNGDSDMCKLLIEHGASREAINVGTVTRPKVISILHFAAADPTPDYRQWKCLFDAFREYIDEPCPRGLYTPLHIAVRAGCTQGMQIAVETGADKEAISCASLTPMSVGILEIPRSTLENPRAFEEHMRCLRKFADLGGSVNPEGDSLLGLAVQTYAFNPPESSLMGHLIHFLLEHHADIHVTFIEPNTNMVNEIIDGIFDHHDNPSALELLKQLLSDLIDRGLNLTFPAPGPSSPLYRVLNYYNSNLEWIFDLLCDNGAKIHEYEVNTAFLRWCETPRLWRTNQYDAWWQHQGQEDEVFLKWCEHPYNAWWWQHVEKISLSVDSVVSLAYEIASNRNNQQLYDILIHLPLSTPSDSL